MLSLPLLRKLKTAEMFLKGYWFSMEWYSDQKATRLHSKQRLLERSREPGLAKVMVQKTRCFLVHGKRKHRRK